MDEMQFLLADSERDFAYLTDNLEDQECFERLVERFEEQQDWQDFR